MSVNVFGDTNFLKMVEDGLKEHVNKQLGDHLTESLVADFKKNIEPIVKETVESITLKGLRSMLDCIEMQQKLDIAFHWTDKKD